MKNDKIIKIGIDDEGKLFVIPKNEKFLYIYREGMEIYWNDENHYLYSPIPKEWSYLDWFKQIIKAVEQQGCILKIVNDTIWINIDI